MVSDLLKSDLEEQQSLRDTLLTHYRHLSGFPPFPYFQLPRKIPSSPPFFRQSWPFIPSLPNTLSRGNTLVTARTLTVVSPFPSNPDSLFPRLFAASRHGIRFSLQLPLPSPPTARARAHRTGSLPHAASSSSVKLPPLTQRASSRNRCSGSFRIPAGLAPIVWGNFFSVTPWRRLSFIPVGVFSRGNG